MQHQRFSTSALPPFTSSNHESREVPKSIVAKLQNIEDEFLKLTNKIRKQLKVRLDKEYINIADLSSFCFGILQVDHTCCGNIHELFSQLQPHLHFLNYDILRKVDHKFLCGHMKSEISIYIKALTIFLKSNTIVQFKTALEKRPPLDDAKQTRIVLKTKSQFWSNCTIYNLDRLVEYWFGHCKNIIRLVTIVSIHHSTLTIVYTAPKSAILCLIALASKRISIMKTMGILSIQIGPLLIKELEIIEQLRPKYRAETLEQLLFAVISAEWYSSKQRALIIELLAYIGINIDTKWQGAITPLIYSVFKKHTDMTNALLQHGANANLQVLDGKTPLMYANSVEVASLLLQHGADINVQDDNGITALARASYDGHLEVVQFLLKCNAKLMDDNPHGMTALAGASKGKSEKHTHIVKELLKHGADPNKYGYENSSPMGPLYVAIYNNCYTNAKVLLDNGANVNLQDSVNGWTPLIIATRYGRLEMVRLFLENGANATTTDNNGGTALTYAVKENHINIAKILSCYHQHHNS